MSEPVQASTHVLKAAQITSSPHFEKAQLIFKKTPYYFVYNMFMTHVAPMIMTFVAPKYAFVMTFVAPAYAMVLTYIPNIARYYALAMIMTACGFYYSTLSAFHSATRKHQILKKLLRNPKARVATGKQGNKLFSKIKKAHCKKEKKQRKPTISKKTGEAEAFLQKKESRKAEKGQEMTTFVAYEAPMQTNYRVVDIEAPAMPLQTQAPMMYAPPVPMAQAYPTLVSAPAPTTKIVAPIAPQPMREDIIKMLLTQLSAKEAY